MKMTLLNKFLFFAFIVGSLLTGQTFAQQSSESKFKRNSPFAPNPKKKVEPPTEKLQADDVKTIPQTEKGDNVTASAATNSEKEPDAEREMIVEKETNVEKSTATITENPQPVNETKPAAASPQYQNAEFESHSVAKKTLEVAKRASTNAAPLTEIYKIGVGDVLFISLQNAPAKESNYFTVLKDGTIDHPLSQPIREP